MMEHGDYLAGLDGKLIVLSELVVFSSVFGGRLAPTVWSELLIWPFFNEGHELFV